MEKKIRNTVNTVTAEDVMTYGQGLASDRRAMLLAAAGNTYQYIASEFGMPVGTVKSRISRARVKVLKAKVKHEGTGTQGN